MFSFFQIIQYFKSTMHTVRIFKTFLDDCNITYLNTVQREAKIYYYIPGMNKYYIEA